MSFDAIGFKFPKNNLNIFDKREVTEITWDGNTTGRETVTGAEFFGGVLLNWCHVSSLLPARENLADGSYFTALDLGKAWTIPDKDIFDLDGGGAIAAQGLPCVVVYKENTYLKGDDFTSDFVFPTTGVWFLYGINNNGESFDTRKLTFGKPMEVDVIKEDLLPVTPVFDLDAHGISVQSLAATGGGQATIDASAIFDSIERGKEYQFRGALAGTILDFPAQFYQYDSSGNLITIGLRIAGDMGDSFIQADVLLRRTYMYMVITPLGM
jgi:hypothetical protein